MEREGEPSFFLSPLPLPLPPGPDIQVSWNLTSCADTQRLLPLRDELRASAQEASWNLASDKRAHQNPPWCQSEHEYYHSPSPYHCGS